jgi:hypothetical protein
MLPTTPAGQRGTRSWSGRIAPAGAPIRRSAVRAQCRTVPNSRRRSGDTARTTTASAGRIAASGASAYTSATDSPGITVAINRQVLLTLRAWARQMTPR